MSTRSELQQKTCLSIRSSDWRLQVASLASLTQLVPHLPMCAIWRVPGSSLHTAAAFPDWVRFTVYCSSIASASATAPRWCPHQLLPSNCVPASAAAPQSCPFHSCCPQIASISAAAPRLCHFQLLLLNDAHKSRLKYKGPVYMCLVQSRPAPPTHTHTDSKS